MSNLMREKKQYTGDTLFRNKLLEPIRDLRGSDRMVGGLTIIYAISAYHH